VYIKVSFFNVNNSCFVAVLNQVIANVAHKLNICCFSMCYIFSYFLMMFLIILDSAETINNVRELTLNKVE